MISHSTRWWSYRCLGIGILCNPPVCLTRRQNIWSDETAIDWNWLFSLTVSRKLVASVLVRWARMWWPTSVLSATLSVDPSSMSESESESIVIVSIYRSFVVVVWLFLFMFDYLSFVRLLSTYLKWTQSNRWFPHVLFMEKKVDVTVIQPHAYHSDARETCLSASHSLLALISMASSELDRRVMMVPVRFYSSPICDADHLVSPLWVKTNEHRGMAQSSNTSSIDG